MLNVGKKYIIILMNTGGVKLPMKKENITLVYQAWRQCVETGQVNSSLINQIISKSWERCLKYKTSPYQAERYCLTEKQLQKALIVNQKLIEVALPFMQKIYQFVAGSGFVVVLLDNNCNILELVGDKGVLESHPHLAKGENWREEYKGTNAMGTMLLERKPIQIYAKEHFCQINHSLTCSAAPIMDANQKLIGILDISGDYKYVHAHTLGMVVAAVGAIENQLGLEQANEKVNMAYEQLNAVVDAMSDGLISFDDTGRIIRINATAKKILGVKGDSALGQELRNVLHTNYIEQSILIENGILNDHEMLLDIPSGQIHFTTSARAIKGVQGRVCGGVMTMREIKQIRKLVTRMTGAQARFSFDDIIGNSKPLEEAIKLAKQTATSNSSIMLYGESGTGKEIFAQAIHNKSLYYNGPFIAINCAAIPRELIESELFGYEEGAFTGAKKGGRPGKFELASGGTIFLDEIGDMPLETQATLLRVLQEKHINRLGGVKSVPVDCRIIAATNKDLYKQVNKGYFRLDLYYRLNVITITIPPLRERQGDILELAKYFIDKLSSQLDKQELTLSTQVEELLLSYWWPGNVRELQNAMERAINVVTGQCIYPQHLPEKIKRIKEGKKRRDSQALSLEEAEKQTILRAIFFFRGNISRAADGLGIGRNTLYRKLKNYGIDLEELTREFQSN